MARRIVYLSIGWTAVALGIAGIFLPLLPTTPFLILAAWSFAKASPKLHAWLLAHSRFGPLIRNWQERGAIPTYAKLLALGMLALSVASILMFVNITAVKLGVSFFIAAVATFILTRPGS